MNQWAEVINTDLSMVGKAGFLNEGRGTVLRRFPNTPLIMLHNRLISKLAYVYNHNSP